jgi:RecA/RadA recombinase
MNLLVRKTMPVDPSTLDTALAQVEKKYGELAVQQGGEERYVDRIPTGSLMLDYATGGGIPIGRGSRFWGIEHSGKTFFSLQIARNAQNIHKIAKKYQSYDHKPIQRVGDRLLERFPEGMAVAYYNVEKVWDKAWAEHIGIDTDKITILNLGTIEEICETMEFLLPSVHVHIVDSASHAVPLDRLKKKIEEWDRGLDAKTWNKGLDRIEHKFDRYDNAVILIDQARVNMNMPGGAVMLEPPGGKRLKHFSSMTLQFKRGKKLYRRDDILQEKKEADPDTFSGDAEPNGFEIQVSVEKSRVGPAFKSARIQFDTEHGGLENLYELAKAAVYFKAVEVKGHWYYYGEEKAQGYPGLRKMLEENDGLRKSVEESVYKAILDVYNEQEGSNNAGGTSDS